APSRGSPQEHGAGGGTLHSTTTGRVRFNCALERSLERFASVSEAVTQGVRVRVDAQWLPEHSSPDEHRWAFSYTVTITNEGAEAATLVARHWVITDSCGDVEHVRGPGVVGYQPS